MIRRFVVVALLVCATFATARADWVRAGLQGHHVRSLLTSTSGAWFASTGDGLYRSFDGGATWGSIEPVLFADAFSAVSTLDSNQVFIAVETGVYRSTDNGDSWRFLGDDVNGTYSLGVAPNHDVYASGSNGTWRSTDRGRNWSRVHLTPGSFTDGIAFDADGRVFLTSVFADFFRSGDNGASWDTLNPTGEYKTALAVSPRTGTVLVGSQTFDSPSMLSVYRSTDAGGTWQRVVHRAGGIDALHFLSNGDALAGADSVLYSNNDGLAWTPRSAGMPFEIEVECFAQIEGHVFAGCRNEGLWREDRLVVAAPLLSPGPSRGLHLSATPSPFASRVTLRFELPSAARVNLDVFSLQGQRVARVADGELAAGPHAVLLDAQLLPAGLYFARLAAGDVVANVTLVLMK